MFSIYDREVTRSLPPRRRACSYNFRSTSLDSRKEAGGGHLCRLPRRGRRLVCPAEQSSALLTRFCLRSLARALAFQRLLAADVDFDRLRLGFRFLGQDDL